MATCTAVLAEFALKQTLQSLPTSGAGESQVSEFPAWPPLKLHVLEFHSSTRKIVRTIGRTKVPVAAEFDRAKENFSNVDCDIS